ncbi:MAG: 2-phosphosulfolactate phosphatase [Candidatus Limnocylindrales bacterium]
MKIEVALVPDQTRAWPGAVCVVIDELRASSTITTLLDLGCRDLYLAGPLAEARRLARQMDGLLIGERHGRAPRGFDASNSPVAVGRMPIKGRHVVLSTTNGTAILRRHAAMPLTLVGCLLNARACAEAAMAAALVLDLPIGIVCAGIRGRFALDDAVAAGLIVEDLREAARARGVAVVLGDAAIAARRLRAAYRDLGAALSESESGHLVRAIGEGDDVAFCARVDSSATVPVLQRGDPLRIVALGPAAVPEALVA